MELRQFVDILEIQRLKARYVRYVDHHEWDKWRDLVTDDLKFFMSASRAREATVPVWSSADEMFAQLSSLPPRITVHHALAPDIEFVDQDHAKGIWAMFDWVDYPTLDYAFKGYGYYHETYVRCPDGRWRISSIHVTRLRTNVVKSREHQPLPPRSHEAKNA